MNTSSASPVLQGKFLLPLVAPPNAGKGTQAPRISKAYGLLTFDMGATFRAILKEGSNPALKAELESFMDQGKLVPLDIVVKVFKSGLEKLAASNPSAKGFILDGFPRSEEQASKLEELCQEWGAQVAKVIYLNVDLNIVKQRATGRLFCKVDSSHVYNLNVSELAPKLQKLDEQGQPIWLCDREHPNLTTEPELYVRKDDEPETVKKRLDEYQKETNPLINYFREQGQLAEIEGAQSPDKVTEDIKAVLTPVLGVPVPELSARL